MLSTLRTLGREGDTLVVLHSDHGYSLGEHNYWGKVANYEAVTRVPLLIRAPWAPAAAGTRTQAIVELIDIYPTVAKLCGAPAPVASSAAGGEAAATAPLQGVDFSHVFEGDPAEAHAHPSAKGAAFSQVARCRSSDFAAAEWPSDFGAGTGYHNSWCHFDWSGFMGYSVRTASWRYTAWVRWSNSSADWGRPPHHEELYEHKHGDACSRDFGRCEGVNVAARRPKTRRELLAMVRRVFERPADAALRPVQAQLRNREHLIGQTS